MPNATICSSTAKARGLRTGTKISWIDLYGNNHDLDFVLERGGTPEKIGHPVAFIESAWRRYTKHSRNKAQEIQGAILPLVTTHQRHAPFIGVILAGEWTNGAITQLHSLGFKVLYFSYQAIIASFAEVGIDAGFEKNTPNAECTKKIKQWNRLTTTQKTSVATHLLSRHSAEVTRFNEALEKAITRQIEMVRILPLHGVAVEIPTIEGALECVEKYNEISPSALPVVRYEIQLKYNNGDGIMAAFASKHDAEAFLRSFLPGVFPA